MADIITDVYEFVLPEPNGSDDSWGVKLNDNFTALDIILQTLIPSGAVLPFATLTTPLGWLECDGSWVLKADYPRLWLAIQDIYLEGEAPRELEFRLPDIRAGFVRGIDNGKGIDVDRVFGSTQEDEFKAHTHDVSGSTNTTGAHTHGYNWYGGGGQQTSSANFSGPVTTLQTTSEGDHSHTVTGTAQSVGGTETRPRNIALNYCIKT